MQAAGCRLQAARCRLSAAECRLQAARCPLPSARFPLPRGGLHTWHARLELACRAHRFLRHMAADGMWHESEHFTLGTTEMFWEAFECWAASVTGREDSIKKENKNLDHNLPNIMRNHVDEQV